MSIISITHFISSFYLLVSASSLLISVAEYALIPDFLPETEMNSTYNAVHDESITTWKFQRLGLVLELAQSSVLPAPLGIFEDLLMLCSCTTAGSSGASSRGAQVIWAATFGADADIASMESCSSCKMGAGTRLPATAQRYLRDARDWVQWMAAASVVNLQHTWGGWYGYFPQGWVWGQEEGLKLYSRCLNSSTQIPTDEKTGDGGRRPRLWMCPCEVCQASSLRRSADVMVEALESWARARSEGDKDRTAAVEAAAAAAAAAERMAKSQVEKVRRPLVGRLGLRV